VLVWLHYLVNNRYDTKTMLTSAVASE